jgi:hypothetical protein
MHNFSGVLCLFGFLAKNQSAPDFGYVFEKPFNVHSGKKEEGKARLQDRMAFLLQENSKC